MADRRDYDRYRGSGAYRAETYYRREQSPKGPGRSILPYQLVVCSLLLLCLLGGWLFNAQWFHAGKQILLEQIDAEDKTAQVQAMLSGFWRQKDKKNPAENGESSAAQSQPDEGGEDTTSQKLEELRRYIEQYGGEKEPPPAAEPAGMGGYLPVAALGTDTGRYPAPEGCLLSPVAVSAKPLLPLKSALVTSIFGYRLHPITEELDFHTGLDLAADPGTRICAAWPGTVEETGWSDIYGNYALVSHGGGLATFYAHCDSIAVKEGTVLRQGELIGYVGETGWATGPHLHWEIRVNGLRVDPAWILGSRQAVEEDGRAKR